MRAAIYWAPELDDPLHAAGSAWLGRDAETAASLPQPALEGIAELTADARGYGLHATLKPPFHLAQGYPALREAVAGFAARQPAFAEIARGAVAVVPLLAGSGTRVKILEAWAAGTPVVSTRIGAEGLPGRDGEHYLLADSPGDLLAAVRRVLGDEGLSHRLRTAGRLLYEKTFHRAAAWRQLDEARLLDGGKRR